MKRPFRCDFLSSASSLFVGISFLFASQALSASEVFDLGKDKTLKINIFTQIQAGASQESLTALQQDSVDKGLGTRHWLRQLQIRRARLAVDAAISKNTTAHFETDVTGVIGSLGGSVREKPTKNGFVDNGGATANINVLEYWIQHQFSNELIIMAGLHLDGLSRNFLLSSSKTMALNAGTFEVGPTNNPLQGEGGRDIGVSARGYLLADRLEYRASVFSGRNFDQYSPLRTTFRLNYNFLDVEKGYTYRGTTLGQNQILAVSGGVDAQGSYFGYSGDVFADISLDKGTFLTGYASYQSLDGGTATSSKSLTRFIPKQNIFYSEVGVYFADLKLQPYVKYETQVMNGSAAQYGLPETASDAQLDYLRKVGTSYSYPGAATAFNVAGTGTRLGAGVNYFFTGFNANLKFLWEQVGRYRAALPTQPAFTADKETWNEFTLQLQFLLI